MQGTCTRGLSWELELMHRAHWLTHHTLHPSKKLALPSPFAELSACFTDTFPIAFFSWDKKAETGLANHLSNLGKASFKKWHSSWLSSSLLHTVLRGEVKGSSQAWLVLGGAWSCSDHSWVSHPLSRLLPGEAEQASCSPFLSLSTEVTWSWLLEQQQPAPVGFSVSWGPESPVEDAPRLQRLFKCHLHPKRQHVFLC